jgi:hypothetical protein
MFCFLFAGVRFHCMRGMHGRPGEVAGRVAGSLWREYLLQQVKLMKRRIMNFLVFLGLIRLGSAAQTRFYQPAYPVSDGPAQHPPARRRR